MQGRSPRAAALSRIENGLDAEAMIAWAKDINFPAILRGDFSHALLYQNVKMTGKRFGPQYLCFYEAWGGDAAIAWSDVTSMLSDRKLNPGDGVVRTEMILKTGNLPPPRGEYEPRGLMVGATDCADPKREAEFNEWYDKVHAQEVLDSGLYQSALRYEVARPDVKQPKYYGFYETEGEGAETLQKLMQSAERSPDPYPDFFLIRGVWTYNLIYNAIG